MAGAVWLVRDEGRKRKNPIASEDETGFVVVIAALEIRRDAQAGTGEARSAVES